MKNACSAARSPLSSFKTTGGPYQEQLRCALSPRGACLRALRARAASTAHPQTPRATPLFPPQVHTPVAHLHEITASGIRMQA
eukprot:884391-Pleurochrysis_carterae.AAC.2